MAANFKLYFNEEDIRRIRLDAPTWDSFRNKLHQLYPEYLPELAIRYKDEEGDMITITTSREWDTMLESSNGISPIKLYITETPQAKVQVSVIEQIEEQIEEPESIPESPVIEEKASTTEIPEGEKEAFEFIQPPSEEPVAQPAIPQVDATLSTTVDMDVNEFFERLQHQARSFLNPAENETLRKAKEFFEGLVPEGNSPLLDEIADAVQGMKRAVCNGYSNLKELPEFKELAELLSGKSEEPDPKRYAAQLETLQSMGFADVELNQALLAKYKGDVQRVVNTLLAAE